MESKLKTWDDKVNIETDDIADLPSGVYPVGSLSVVADDRAVYLVINVRGAMRQIAIELARKKEAEAADQSADLCREALIRKFGPEMADEVVKYLIGQHGPNWAAKYIPLTDHILEFYDDARLVMLALASGRGGDTW